MERLKRIVLYLAGFLIIINMYAVLFLDYWTIGNIMQKKVFFVLIGLFILTTQLIEGVMYVIYMVVKLKPWLRILLTTVCSVITYCLILFSILPRFYEIVMTQQYILVGVFTPDRHRLRGCLLSQLTLTNLPSRIK